MQTGSDNKITTITTDNPKQDLPAPAEFAQLKEICQITVRSKLIPQKTWEEAFTVAMKGRELGIPPMLAFTHINVIQGKPAISPELMLALIMKKFPTARFEFVERSDTLSKILVTRPGQKTETWEFSFEDAKKMNLTSKDNYKKQAATMLQWRNISQIARAKFSDALMGASYTPEELGAVVNEEGEVIDIPSHGSAELHQNNAPSNPPSPYSMDSSLKQLEAEIAEDPSTLSDEELLKSFEYTVRINWPKSRDGGENRDNPYGHPLKHWRNPAQTGYVGDGVLHSWSRLQKISLWITDKGKTEHVYAEFQKHFARVAEYFERHKRRNDPKDEPPVQTGDELIGGWDDLGKR